MKSLKFIISLALILVSLTTLAQGIITDRPDQTESSSTVALGSFQIETGVLYGIQEYDREILAPTTLFRYGLTKGIEIRVTNQFESMKSYYSYDKEVDYEKVNLYSWGLSDLEVGAKFQLFQKEDINTEIAFLTHIVIPTGTKGISGENWGTVNKLAVSHSLNDNAGIGYNIGYNNFGKGNGDLTYAVVFGLSINDKMSIFIESFGDYVDFEMHNANFDAGVTYLLFKNLQLDFSFGSGINYEMNYIATGFSWNISK